MWGTQKLGWKMEALRTVRGMLIRLAWHSLKIVQDPIFMQLLMLKLL